MALILSVGGEVLLSLWKSGAISQGFSFFPFLAMALLKLQREAREETPTLQVCVLSTFFKRMQIMKLNLKKLALESCNAFHLSEVLPTFPQLTWHVLKLSMPLRNTNAAITCQRDFNRLADVGPKQKGGERVRGRRSLQKKNEYGKA